MTREEIVAQLMSRGATKDRATMYADAFIEYRSASENIEAFGIIVQHPRTANPIENPYLAIRDRALAKLKTFTKMEVEFLW